jgi:hypothetical protein
MLYRDDIGRERAFGNVALFDGPPAFMAGWPVYGQADAAPLVPRDHWPALIAQAGDGPEHPCLPPVHDQGRLAQCNADATAAAAEFCRAVQGLNHVQLSPADLYARINYGNDRGSLLEDAMAEATGVGIGTARTCGLLWRPGMTLASLAERARFRVLECYVCPTFEHLMSAVLSGFAVISGVMWYERYQPDARGWLPALGEGAAGGHAIMGYKPAMRGKAFGIWHQNSYSARWGLGGRCVLPEGAYRTPIGGWWAVRQMTTEAGELPALVA